MEREYWPETGHLEGEKLLIKNKPYQRYFFENIVSSLNYSQTLFSERNFMDTDMVC